MEFRGLKRQYQLHKEAIDSAIQKVLDEGQFIEGKQVKELEEELRQYVGVKHCVSCGNGTDALQLALMVWNIGPGDAVFVPDFTFFASGEVVAALGATPIFVDIEESTYNISIKSLEKAINKVIDRKELIPRVIIAVDLFGQPADYSALRVVAEKYNLLILEDGAQGFGGSMSGKKSCGFGDISTTSFFPAKPLGCFGDGGAIFTNNDYYEKRLRSLCVHGKGIDKYDNICIGMNSRLDTLQAAVLLEKLKFFDDEVKKCNIIAAKYTNKLKGKVKIPVVLTQMYSSWAQYTIQLQDEEERSNVMQRMKKQGIPSAIYYKKPMHQQKAFAGKGIEMFEYTVAEHTSHCCVSLPMHAYLEDKEINTICQSVIEGLKIHVKE